MPTGYTTFEEQVRKSARAGWDKQLADTDALYANQAASINKNYDSQVDKQSKAYEDSYRENAIQKLINERQVAENMANLGLTNSGLNRTQQTAVQLSYANNKAGIDKQKQSDIADINLARTQALDTNEQNRLKDRMAINEANESAITKAAQENYKNYLKVLEEQNKVAQESEKTTYKVRTAGGSGLDSAGNEVYYFYDENGKKLTYPKGTNPYTGKPITGGYTAKEIESYGGVWNGYQPKGVKYNGQNYGAVNKYLTDKGSVQIEHQGHYKTIWQTKDGSLWVWDDEVGNYVRAYDDGKGNISYESY